MSVTLSKAKLLCMENHRNKKLSSTVEALSQINKIPTLSQRLKVAGIKECKPGNDEKRNNMKNIKKRNYYKKLYLEKATSKTFKSTSKTKGSPTKDYLLPYVKDPSRSNEVFRGEVPSKNYTGFPKPMDPNIQANTKETIFVSLDFLQDCQNYKRSIRKSKFPNMRFQKKIPIKRRRSCLTKKRETIKVKRVPYRPEKQEPSYDNVRKKYSPPKTKLMARKTSEQTGPIIFEASEEQRAPVNYDFNFPFETDFQIKFQEKVSQDSVGKIDKRFLESLLSIAMSMGKGDKTKDEKESRRVSNERQAHRKGKITGKAFFEGKIQSSELEGVSLKKERARSPMMVGMRPRGNFENESEAKVSFKELISAKPPRDTAKSEVQIPPIKGSSGEGSKMKSEKNMSLSKPDTDETRKKRKNRNKIMKVSSEEFVEASYPSEVSKVADVKELWRRDADEKSDNSLSSYSSCTVPEGDEVPEWKSLGLQSYKTLKKLVEEEVTKITPKSAKKDNTTEVENEENISKTDISKETEKPKINLNKLQEPLEDCSENTRKGKDKKENESVDAQREQVQVKKKQHYSVYEGKKQKSQLTSLPPEETDNKGSKEKLELPDEMTGKTMCEVPSAVVQEWSIINRLEQAFLVLGTPNFEDEGMRNSIVVQKQNSNPVKKINQGPEKVSEGVKRKIRKQRSKEELGKKKAKNAGTVGKGATPRTPEDSSFSSTNSHLPRKKIKLDNKSNALKEKQKKIRPETGVMKGRILSAPATPSISHPSRGQEHKSKLKEKRTPRSTPDGLLRKSAPSKSLEKLKANALESRHTKREMKGSKNRECLTPPEQAKAQDAKHNKSNKTTTKATKLHSTHGKRLERKKTFNVIQTKETTGVQPRKSKSCNKIEENYDRDGVKICFSQTKAHRNGSVKPERVTEKETPKRNLKKVGKGSPVKEKPLHSNEKSKNGEKDSARGNREGLLRNPRTRVVQEKKTEKPSPPEVLPQQITARKRAIKERSILSMRLNQQGVPEHMEKLSGIQKNSDSVVPVLTEAKTSESHEVDLQIDSNALQQNFLRKYSNISCISTSNFNLVGSKPQSTCTETRVRLIIREFQDEGAAEDPVEILSTPSLSNHVFGKRQSTILGVDQTEMNHSKRQQLWEQDLNYYHSIVREIMSHYKRIDGFLKQSEQQFDGLSSSLINLAKKNSDADEECNALRNDLHSLQEYRKKVIYEYQALPFCEYKSQVQQKKEESTKSEDGRKRNLQVVKEMNTESDVDVKDFRLNIQKVLDSQLYVDADVLVKRNESLLKFKDVPLYKSENSIKQN